jgi:hypothetical protein
VYLIYVDDSRQEKEKGRNHFQVICAVIVNDAIFDDLEQHLGYYLYELVQPDVDGAFEEFHATDILSGKPPFHNIKRDRALEILSTAVSAVNGMDIPVVYGAVDLDKLNATNYATANAIDMAFRICVKLVEEWFQENARDGLGLLISDDADQKIKHAVLNAFHLFRNRVISSPPTRGILQHLHDDMYFGNSKFSKGIQLADICTLLISRHLAGYSDTEDLYRDLSRMLVKSSVEPV